MGGWPLSLTHPYNMIFFICIDSGVGLGKKVYNFGIFFGPLIFLKTRSLNHFDFLEKLFGEKLGLDLGHFKQFRRGGGRHLIHVCFVQVRTPKMLFKKSIQNSIDKTAHNFPVYPVPPKSR